MRDYFRRGTYKITCINNRDYRIQEQRRKLLRVLEESEPQVDRPDVPLWLWNNNGKYAVSSCYKIVTYRGVRDKMAIAI